MRVWVDNTTQASTAHWEANQLHASRELLAAARAMLRAPVSPTEPWGYSQRDAARQRLRQAVKRYEEVDPK